MYFRTRVQIPAPPIYYFARWGPFTFPTSLRARGRLRRLPSGPRLQPQALVLGNAPFNPRSRRLHGARPIFRKNSSRSVKLPAPPPVFQYREKESGLLVPVASSIPPQHWSAALSTTDDVERDVSTWMSRHSLGGHNTLVLAAFDERVKAMVTSCGFTSMRKYDNGNLAGLGANATCR